MLYHKFFAQIKRLAALVVFLLPAAFSLHAQGVNPEVQFWIDSTQRWLTIDIQDGVLDTAQLNKLNNHIRLLQDSINRVDMASKPLLNGNEEKLIKEVFLGGSLKVPVGETWKMLGLYVKSESSSYRLKVTSVKLKDIYSAGESIMLPLTSAEASLISDGEESNISYQVEILKIKRP